MKICMTTDSRGVWGNEKSWCELLIKEHPENEYFISRANNRYFTTIFDHIGDIVNSGRLFDICLLQLGYIEYVVPWTMPVWKSLGFSEEELKKSLTPFPTKKIGEHLFDKCFLYRNDNEIKKHINLIRCYCKKVLYISIPYNWEEFEERTIMTNEVFSRYCDESIILPMDKDFPAKYTLYDENDRIHYTEDFTPILAKMVWDKIDSMGLK